MRVIIAGGRDFNDYQYLCEIMDHVLRRVNKDKLVIVNGDGPGKWDNQLKKYVTEGADQLGKRYANERGYELDLYPPDWKGLGKKAGPIRNKQMAQNADALVAFNTGGNGTKSMISLAEEHGLKVRVINCLEE